MWFEEHCPELAREVLTQSGLPLWAWSGAVQGYGYGYGDGSGYGDGTHG